jgi:hypothetical protein
MGHFAGPRPSRRKRKPATGIGIAEHRDADLPQIALALAAGCSQPGLLHSRHEQADQSAHDRDHDQQFNQRESTQWLSFGPDGWRNKTPKVPLGILLAEVVAAETP